MLDFIKLLIFKYRFNDLVYYLFNSKNRFKNYFLKTKIIIDDNQISIIFAKYSKLLNKEHKYSKIWNDIVGEYYKDLTDAFLKKDFNNFKEILNIFLKSSVIRGAEDGNLYKNAILELSHKVTLIRSIYFLSNYLGISKFKNPYQPELIKKETIVELYSKIQIEIPIYKLPKIGSPYGLKWEDSVINWRFIESIYWNLTIKNFIKNKPGSEKLNILEIGGGSGLNSIVFYNFFKDIINNFYLIDIPHILLFQEYFVKNSIDLKEVNNKFSFIDNLNIDILKKEKFDIFLNKDSLPEINDKDSEEYFKLIANNKGAYLFSINHESNIKKQKNVFQSIKKYNNIELISREEFPIRKGYIKEIFLVK